MGDRKDIEEGRVSMKEACQEGRVSMKEWYQGKQGIKEGRQWLVVLLHKAGRCPVQRGQRRQWSECGLLIYTYTRASLYFSRSLLSFSWRSVQYFQFSTSNDTYTYVTKSSPPSLHKAKSVRVADSHWPIPNHAILFCYVYRFSLCLVSCVLRGDADASGEIEEGRGLQCAQPT
jgi:hypothetical protein